MESSKGITKFNIDSFSDKDDFLIPNLIEILNIKIKRNPYSMDKSVYDEYSKWTRANWGAFLNEKELDQYLEKDVFKLSSICYPDFDRGSFIEMAKMIDYLYLVDDIFLEKKKFTLEMGERIINKSSQQDELGKIFWNIINELYKYSDPSSIERLVNSNYYYCITASKASEGNTFHSSMTFKEYYEYRSYDAAGFCFFLTGLSNTFHPISNEIYNSKEMKKVEYNFNACGMLGNDILSFKKEKYDLPFSNYVKILSVQNNSIQIGIDKSVDLIRVYSNKFLKSIDKLCKTYPNNPAIEILCKNTFSSLYGTVASQTIVKRYTDHN